MSYLKHARSFRDLVVYQRVRHVAKDVFELTKGFPKEERYSLTDQVRRSSRSVVGRMLGSMMQKSNSFCGQDSPMVREDPAEYFVTDN